MLKKVYYYNYYDINGRQPFVKEQFLEELQNIFDLEDFTSFQVPNDLEDHEEIYTELFNLVMSKYHNHACIKIVKCFNEEEPSQQEKYTAFKEFMYRYLALLNDTYYFYMTLLAQYNAAKDSLMADVKATSSNKVKFNDTPQNPNNEEVYEGDNYITHFTSTEGENSSPLMTKMMRLKEIQDNYRDLMSEWVRDFERIFFQEDC